MSSELSLEELYIECLNSGMNVFQADERVNQVLYYRYLDSLEEFEQTVRHGYYMDGKMQQGMYELDLLEAYDFEIDDEHVTEGAHKEISSDAPSYGELVEEVKHLKDKMNDILIDKHLVQLIKEQGFDVTLGTDEDKKEDKPKKKKKSNKGKNETKDKDKDKDTDK